MQEHIKKILEEIEQGKSLLIDVREKDEWEAGHLSMAKLYPLSVISEGDDPEEELDSDKKMYIHCRSGNRVYQAKPLLEAMGYKEVIALKEGLDDLLAEGLEKA